MIRLIFNNKIIIIIISTLKILSALAPLVLSPSKCPARRSYWVAITLQTTETISTISRLDLSHVERKVSLSDTKHTERFWMEHRKDCQADGSEGAAIHRPVLTVCTAETVFIQDSRWRQHKHLLKLFCCLSNKRRRRRGEGGVACKRIWSTWTDACNG